MKLRIHLAVIWTLWIPHAAAQSPPTEEIRTFHVQEPITGGRAYVIEAGMSHPVSAVLVHGAGEMGADIWRDLIPELAKSYHVVAFDLPGFVGSDKRNVRYGPSLHASS